MMKLEGYILGREGLASADKKIEGDYKTPLGTYPLREVWYRPDRVTKPQSGLPMREITPEDCWCDDAGHGLYNQHFKLNPHQLSRDSQASPRKLASPLKGEEESLPTSFERLWREDGAYDVIVVIGYNDAPITPGKGSAIFMHCMHDDRRPTAGCVALEKDALLSLASQFNADSKIRITKNDVSII